MDGNGGPNAASSNNSGGGASHIRLQPHATTSFPSKLWAILNHQPAYKSIGWVDEGASFEIVDSKQLETEVLPSYFKTNKANSFKRQAHCTPTTTRATCAR